MSSAVAAGGRRGGQPPPVIGTAGTGTGGGYKSRICGQYSMHRACESGDSCGMAHGKKELRTYENPLYKSQLCTAFTQSGTCQLADDCLFAHDALELRPDDDELEELSIGSSNQNNQMGGGTHLNRQPPPGTGSGSDSGGSPISGSSQQHHQHQSTPLSSHQQPTRILSRSFANNSIENGGSSHAGGNMMQRSHNGNSTNSGPPSCHAFQRNGSCNRGANCQYAHVPKMSGMGGGGGDMSDNSSVVSGGYAMGGQMGENGASGMMGSKYKTALCHAFQKNNRCANGDNCRYAHGMNELQPTPEKAPPAPMDPSDPKYKTKLCIKFEKEKKCLAGDNCNFAHGIEELRNRSPEDEQKVSDRYKTSVCQIFLEKVICPRGPNCTYAHGRYELRPIGFKGDFEAKVSENPRWKCNLCKAWSETNRCKNGDDCSYAHGEKELRSEKPGPPEVRRFKTELCKKLFTQGFCPQGSICTFAHCENDLQQNRNSSLSSSSKTSPVTMMGSMQPNVGYSPGNMFGNEQSNSMMSGGYKLSSGVVGSGMMDRPGQMGLHSSAAAAAAMHSPTMMANKGAMMGRSGPNKDVEMFSDFLEFMKLKETGVLDMIKHATGPSGMMPRQQHGASNPAIPTAMSAGGTMGYSGNMGANSPFMNAQFSNAGGLGGPGPMDPMGASSVMPMGMNGQSGMGGSTDGRLMGSGMANNGLVDYSPMNPQMRKRKYEHALY